MQPIDKGHAVRLMMTALLALPLAACSALPPNHPPAASGRWATPLKQDANLFRIDDKLYRSEQPIADDVAAIRQLGIQSVINLRYFDRNDDRQHLGDLGLNLINQPLKSWYITPKHIAQTLYRIEKAQQHGAVLIHCYHGADRTGLIAGMYRIIYQGWTVEASKQEMIHGPYGYLQHLEKYRQSV